MITHAAYHAANPLPHFRAPLFVPAVSAPKVGAGRVHRIAVNADSTPRIVSQSEYIAALSKTEWRDTSTISVALGGIYPHVVKQRLLGPNMSPLVEMRTAGRGRYEWRLK